MDEKSDLLDELQFEFDRALRLAKVNTLFSISMVWIALAASAISGPALLANLIGPKIGGIVASLPAVLVLIESTISFHARSSIRWEQVVRLKALKLQLKHEGKPEAEISAALRRLDDDMAQKWQSEVNVGIISYWRSIRKKSRDNG
jgi:hypothetical protein